ncbi:MAG: EamA family transporter [Arenicella sp.]|nr:EamA family transporter [Arenicella sp.]
MSAIPWIVLFVGLLFTALGQFFFKLYYLKNSSRYVLLAIGCFISVPLFIYWALQSIGIGTVYMSTALTHIMILFLSWAFLKEQLTRHHFISMAFIISGVVLYAA